MKVVVYEPHYNEKHRQVLRAFAQGAGAHVRDVRKYVRCDIAVIFGAKKHSYQPTWTKEKILVKHKGRRLIMIESAFVKRGEYWQVGFGGFSGDADFRNENSPPDRWNALGITLKPWRKDSCGPYVVCGQIPHDTQVQDVDHVGWCRHTVLSLLAKGWPVKFRPHPKIKDYALYGVPENLMDLRSLDHTLNEARCVITWNSTVAVDAIIAGVPAVTCSPSSISWPVAMHSVEEAAELKYPDRKQWCNNLGYAQWNLEEMQEGKPWQHLTRQPF